MNIQIRNMMDCDINAVTNLEKECFSLPWSEQSLIESMENTNNHFFVAVVNEKVVGYIGSMFVLDEVQITDIAVTEDFRKNNIGNLLLSHIIKLAENENMSFITLEVRKSNLAAINLYSKNSFINLGIRKNFYIKPTEDAIIMIKYFK